MPLHLNSKQVVLVIQKTMEQKENGIKIAVPLKYLINFWRSLEMPLINWKVELSLKWIENCVLNKAANANNATFKITDAKMYVPIANLSGEANAKFYQNY